MNLGAVSVREMLVLMDSAKNTEIRSAAAAESRRYGRVTGLLSSFVGLRCVPVVKENRRGTGIHIGGCRDGCLLCCDEGG